MKILAIDRKVSRLADVTPYVAAQVREFQELARSDHSLAAAAASYEADLLAGRKTVGEAYKLVEQAKGPTGRALLSAQIDAQLLAELKVLAKEREQLFKDLVEEMVAVYLMAARDQTNGGPASGTDGNE